MTGVALIVFWPAAFYMTGDGTDAAASAKGEIAAIEHFHREELRYSVRIDCLKLIGRIATPPCSLQRKFVSSSAVRGTDIWWAMRLPEKYAKRLRQRTVETYQLLSTYLRVVDFWKGSIMKIVASLAAIVLVASAFGFAPTAASAAHCVSSDGTSPGFSWFGTHVKNADHNGEEPGQSEGGNPGPHMGTPGASNCHETAPPPSDRAPGKK